MILNLTQHPATAAQAASGVVDLPAIAAERLGELLTLKRPQRTNEKAIREWVEMFADFVVSHFWEAGEDVEDDGPWLHQVMIGGQFWLKGPLAAALHERGIDALYEFSSCNTIERTLPDGSVEKKILYHYVME